MSKSRTRACLFRRVYDELNGERPYGGELTLLASMRAVRGAGCSAPRIPIAARRRAVSTRTNGESPRPTRCDLSDSGKHHDRPYDLQRRRTGMNATLEWRPAAGQRYYIRGFFSRLEEDEVRQRFRYSFRNNPQTLTQTAGTANGNHRDVDLRIRRQGQALPQCCNRRRTRSWGAPGSWTTRFRSTTTSRTCPTAPGNGVATIPGG